MPNKTIFKNHEEYLEYYREYRKKNRVKFREYNKEYNKKYRKEYGYANEEKWIEDNLYKRRAQRKLQYAVKTGRVEKKNCEVCGSENSQGHHEDYLKAYEVKWLCPICHKKRHIELKS